MAEDRGRKRLSGGKVTGMIVVVVALIFAGALGGCATFSGNGGFGAVEQVARERLNKDVEWQRDDGQEEQALHDTPFNVIDFIGYMAGKSLHK